MSLNIVIKSQNKTILSKIKEIAPDGFKYNNHEFYDVMALNDTKKIEDMICILQIFVDKNKKTEAEQCHSIEYAKKVVATVKNHVGDYVEIDYKVIEDFIIEYYDELKVFDELPPLEPLRDPQARPINKKSASFYTTKFENTALYEWLLEVLGKDRENIFDHFSENENYATHWFASDSDYLCVGDVIGPKDGYRSDGMYIVTPAGKLEQIETTGSNHSIVGEKYTSLVDNPKKYWMDVADYIELAADHPRNPYGRKVSFCIYMDPDEPIFEDPRDL